MLVEAAVLNTGQEQTTPLQLRYLPILRLATGTHSILTSESSESQSSQANASIRSSENMTALKVEGEGRRKLLPSTTAVDTFRSYEQRHPPSGGMSGLLSC